MHESSLHVFSTVVPGPTNPKHKIDVFLKVVVTELEQFWEEGVLKYDIS